MGVLCFCLGLVMEGAMAMIGLLAMDCAPDHLQGTAHGIACAMAQGEEILTVDKGLGVFPY